MSTTLDLPENVEATLSYLLFFVSGIFFYVVEKRSRFVRFHALQSTIMFISLFVLDAILRGFRIYPPFFYIYSPFYNLFTLLIFLLWIICMYKAYTWEWFKIPIFGDIAIKNI